MSSVFSDMNAVATEKKKLSARLDDLNAVILSQNATLDELRKSITDAKPPPGLDTFLSTQEVLNASTRDTLADMKLIQENLDQKAS
jgi:hypothetical protein